MKRCTGIIYNNGDSLAFQSLTKLRPSYMLPFGGRYRIIDFALSNMTNHNLSEVILYAGKRIRSTLDHIGDGKNWELNRRNHGLMINPAVYDATGTRSEMQTYFDSVVHFEHLDTDAIYVANPMYLCKPNLNVAFDDFAEMNYDVMLFYSEVEDPMGYYLNMRKLILDSNGTLLNVGLNLGTENRFNLYMAKLLIKRQVFIDVVRDAVERGDAKTLIQAIMNRKSRLNIGTYKLDQYFEIIHDVVSYYRANMNLLDRKNYDALFYQGGMVYTKSKDEPSTLYKASSKVSNSLIANGCTIEGQVENSILFRGVHIGRNAIIKNSILIQKTDVDSEAVLVNTITDKYAHIGSGVSLVGSVMNPFVVEKNQFLER